MVTVDDVDGRFVDELRNAGRDIVDSIRFSGPYRSGPYRKDG
jgi:hypothetical protein